MSKKIKIYFLENKNIGFIKKTTEFKKSKIHLSGLMIYSGL